MLRKSRIPPEQAELESAERPAPPGSTPIRKEMSHFEAVNRDRVRELGCSLRFQAFALASGAWPKRRHSGEGDSGHGQEPRPHDEHEKAPSGRTALFISTC